jgi:hypothetical protein
MNTGQSGKRRCALAAMAMALALHATRAAAFGMETASGLEIDIDTTLTYGAQWRIEEADARSLRRVDPAWSFAERFAWLSDRRTVIAQNMDDGNNAFDEGLVSSRASALADIELRYADYGALLRVRGFHDRMYESESSDMDATGYATFNGRPDVDRGDFPDGTVEHHGADLDLLDAYVYGSLDVGERLLDLRLGRQVINWGEATFFPGINGMQNRFDAAAATVPGIEVKEILLPTGALYGQIDLGEALSLQAYYQYEWKRTRLNGVGSYFSQQDYLGPGAQSYYVGVLELFGLNPFVPRRATDEADDQGQWGGALVFSLESGTELGVYYVRAHNRSPAFELERVPLAGQELPVSYRVHYFEDIDTVGASFTTLVGDVQVNGEVSLRSGLPMADAAGDPRRDDIAQAQLGFTQVVKPTALWDDLTVLGELVAVQDLGREDDELAFDASAFAYALRADFAYKNVLQALDLNVPVFLQHTVNGTVRESNMVDGAVLLSVGLRGTYLDRWVAELSMARYFGGGFDNWGRDRDNVSFNLKYSF